MLSIDYDRTSNVFIDVFVGTKNHNFKFSLFLDKYNIIIKTQKIKFMQDFTFAINVECLLSSLLAKLVMRDCACAKHTKTCFFVKYKEILKAQPSGKYMPLVHIYNRNKYRSTI